MPNIHSRRDDSHPISAAAYLEQVQDERDALAAELAAARARLEESEAKTVSSLKQLIYLTEMQLSCVLKFNKQQRKAARTGDGARVGDQPRVAAPSSRDADADETHAGENIAAASSPAHMLFGDTKSKNASSLREALAILDLDTKGTKEVLRKRILDHFENDAAGKQRFLATANRMLCDYGLHADDAAEEDAENVPPCHAPVEPIAGPSDIHS